MELPIKPQSDLIQSLTSFFKPFTQTYIQENKRFIMPLHQVEKILHTHYVTEKPVSVTFEYYDRSQQIQTANIIATILSPVREDLRIPIQDSQSNRTYLLSLEQILTVSANAA